MTSTDCIFCKIVRGEIPNYTVYEDDQVLAFLDIHPCAKGHTLIIPKKHFESLKEMDYEEWQGFMRGLNTARERIEEVLRPEGLNAGINERAAAGQAVPHAHWHIIPRWEGDGGGSMHSIIKSKSEVNVKAVAELFRSNA